MAESDCTKKLSKEELESMPFEQALEKLEALVAKMVEGNFMSNYFSGKHINDNTKAVKNISGTNECHIAYPQDM